MKEPDHISDFISGHATGRFAASCTPVPAQQNITRRMQMNQLEVRLLITTESNLD